MSNDPHFPDDNLGIQGEVRKISVDDSSWHVFEFVSPRIPRRPPVLVFHAVGRDEVFETVDYPKTWRTLSDADLLALVRKS
ncbi:MAG TPA: hypothetical protein VN706_16140 [Gemmatimonadaceae bacterium]|nr:hypothetical protein [Gemmatimonadaceae bacterium]